MDKQTKNRYTKQNCNIYRLKLQLFYKFLFEEIKIKLWIKNKA